MSQDGRHLPRQRHVWVLSTERTHVHAIHDNTETKCEDGWRCKPTDAPLQPPICVTVLLPNFGLPSWSWQTKVRTVVETNHHTEEHTNETHKAYTPTQQSNPTHQPKHQPNHLLRPNSTNLINDNVLQPTTKTNNIQPLRPNSDKTTTQRSTG